MERVQVTASTLATSLVFLDQTDGRGDLKVKGEGIVSDLLNRLVSLKTSHQDLVDLLFFLDHRFDLFLRRIVVSSLLLLFAFLATTLFALLLLAVALNGVLEDDIDGDGIILLEVAGHWDLDHGGVVLKIEEKTVKMDVDGAGTEVVEDQVLLDLANAANRALQHLLDEDALLRVLDLIVALLELAVDLNVLNVQDRIVREPFLEAPKLTILLTVRMKVNNCCII